MSDQNERRDTDNAARKRIRQIFEYLRALHQHRSPPKLRLQDQLWFRWFSDLPTHPAVSLGRRGNDGENFLLRVQRPSLSAAPRPLRLLRDWVEDGWDDPRKPLRFRASLEELDEHGQRRLLQFEDDPRRVEACSEWVSRRDEWAREETPAREAMDVFDALFAVWGRIQRESEQVELVLGDGILRWSRSVGDVFHPILLQRVELEFDDKGPEFRVVDADFPTEFYDSAFSSGDDFDAHQLKRFKEELVDQSLHPLDGDDASVYLKSVAVRLSARGEFLESRPGAPTGADPIMGRDPALFLRSRSQGFTQVIEGILQALDDGHAIPSSLAQVVGLEPPPAAPPGNGGESSRTPAGTTDILFSKLSNPEQFRIAERLSLQNAVLVQGPPGTGKSHTIANLIGHLLAEGKSILVTSHTTKALKVLRDHVVLGLRPLCVSVLERDTDSRQQLEEAVGAIVARLSTSDEKTLLDEARALREERAKLQSELEGIRNKIRLAREAEYEPIAIGGETLQPAEAARWLALEEEECAWILGPVEPGAPLPLGEDELRTLYQSNGILSIEDERECADRLPSPETLISPSEMTEIVRKLEKLESGNLEVGNSLWDETNATTDDRVLEKLLDDLGNAIEPIGDGAKWRLTAIQDGSRSGGAQPWENLLRMIRNTQSAATQFTETDLRFAARLPRSVAVEDAKGVLGEIQEYVRQKGKLPWNFFMPSRWRTVVSESRVNGKPPSQLEHFRALSSLAELDRQRTTLRERWNRQIASLGGPSGVQLGPRPEEGAAQFVAQIQSALTWYRDTWSPLEQRLCEVGLKWQTLLNEQPPVLGEHGHLERLRKTVVGPLDEILRTRGTRLWRERAVRRLAEQRDNLGQYPSGSAARMKFALERKDVTSYESAYLRLKVLFDKLEVFERRSTLLKRLRAAATAWADAVAERREPHDSSEVPGDPKEAWKWRQVAQALDVRSQLDERALADRLARREQDLRHVTSELIDRLAWASQLNRTGSRERKALVGWLDTMRRIGKGTGKRAPRLRAEARKLLSEARPAVPVWIMPMSRAAESFDPLKTKFDVVIVDEASQSDVLGLTTLYLGEKVLVVGDHEQVSPSAVGQKLDIVESLITTHLDGIPLKHLYDGQYSIYDVARSSFGSAIRLVEHFRCVPEIIDFSNWLSYGGDIKPLRDPSTVDLRPSVVDVYVAGATVDSKVNEKEAELTAALLVAATEQPDYGDKTFGVISLVGVEQAQAIETLLERVLPITEYKRRAVLCGNAASFQGDERDVMFLSLVDAPVDGPLVMRDTTMFRQRFNVAASRAKDQMWLVHSLRPQVDLKPGDLRKRLIDYVRDPASRPRATEQAQRRAQSDFERKVIERLIAAGYRLRPQVSVGYYRIDIVVYGEDRRVAIECDGDRYHPVDKIPEDMARQAILERLGWRFIRIRGSRFYRDPDGSMTTVFEKLCELGIDPTGTGPAEKSGDETSTELKERVIRRAYELLRSWSEAEVARLRPA